MGGKTDSSNPAANAQAELAKQLAAESSPLRNSLLSSFTSQFQNGYDPGASPVFSAGKNVLESQFANAKDSIIANTASGGALMDRLADQETQKAIALGNLAAGTSETDLNRAIQMATGITSGAQSGFGSAAAAQAQQAQAQAAEKGGLGQAAGTTAALMLK